MLPKSIEVQVNATLMNSTEAEAAKARQKYHRKQQAVIIKAILTQQRQAAEDTLAKASKQDTHLSTNNIPRTVVETGGRPAHSKTVSPFSAKIGQDKKPSLANGKPPSFAPVPKSQPTPFPLPSLPTSPTLPDPNFSSTSDLLKAKVTMPLQSYTEWHKQKSIRLPSPWKKVDFVVVDDEEDEEKIELPKSIEDRQRLLDKLDDDQEARDRSADADLESKLVPVTFQTPTFKTLDDCYQITNPTTILPAVQSPSNLSKSVLSISDSPSKSLSPNSPMEPSPLTAELSAQDTPAMKDNVLKYPIKNHDQAVTFDHKFNSEPVKPQQNHKKKKSKSKVSQSSIPYKPKSCSSKQQSDKFSKKCIKKSPAPGANVELFEQFEVLKRASGTYTWISESEALALIVYLLAVIGVLIYRETIIE